MEHLVRQAAQRPEEPIAVPVVDGRLPHRELTQLLDPLLDHSSGIVAPPSGEGVDAGDVREDVAVSVTSQVPS